MYRPLLLLVAVLLAVAAAPAHAQTTPTLDHPALDAHRAHAERLLQAFPAAPPAARPAANTYVLDTRTRFTPAVFGGALQADTQSRYTYDGTRLTAETRYDAQNGGWQVSGRTVYEYTTGVGVGGDLLGRETDETWDAEASAFVPQYRTIYTYAGSQGSGLPTTVLEEEWTGSEWAPIDRQLYTVVGTGTSAYYSTGEYQVWSEGEWVPEERFLVTQDGSDVVFTNEVWTGTGWENDSRIRYHDVTIADLWARVRQLEEQFEQNPGVFFAYQFPAYTTEDWDGSAWVRDSRSTTDVEYDFGTGIILSVTNLYEDWDDMEEAWLPGFRIVTEYEVVGSGSRPARTAFEMWDEEEEDWVGFFEDVYTYDAVSGRIASATTQLSFFEMTVVLSRTEFTWRLAAGTSVGGGAAPVALRLEAPFPNPTAGAVRLAYRVDASGPVALRVYDALGRLALTVVEGTLPAGEHHATFAAGSLPSGRYVVRLETASGHETRALTVAR
jgi:hypothetical protein